MFCTKCGKESSPGDVYCSGCGTRLKTGEAMQKKKHLNNWITLALAAVVLILGAVMVFRKGPESVPVQTLPPKLETQPQTETSPQTEASTPGQSTPEAAESSPETAETPQQNQQFLSEESRSEYGSAYLVRYRYDSTGNLIWKDTGDGYIHTYSYRTDGTLEKEGISFDGEPTSVILYDEQGNSVSESDLQGYIVEYQNTYDNQKRLISRQRSSESEGLIEESLYTYGVDGGYTLNYIDYADGAIHCNKYTVYDAQGKMLSFSQNLESGMVVRYETTHTYDDRGSLLQTRDIIDIGDYREERLDEYVNTYNDAGKLIQAERYVTIQSTGDTSQSRTLERTICSTYDSAGRLVRQENIGGDGNWSYVYTWEYDTEGNLLRHTEGGDEVVQTYTYLPLEQVQ